jgi:hypothetical protein
LDQGGHVEVDAAAAIKAMDVLTADEFQEVDSGRVDKICHDFVASENDANVFDVHVVDDICLSTEGTCLWRNWTRLIFAILSVCDMGNRGSFILL